MCGLVAAIFIRFWVIFTTYFLLHPKESKVHEMIANKIKANRQIRTNKLKFYIGMTIMFISISKKNHYS
jgi:hypothetical protein